MEEQMEVQSSLLDKLQDAVFALDLDGHILYWNRCAEYLYGWATDEAIGKHAGELIFDRLSLQFEEAKKAVFDKDSWFGELSHKTRDGKDLIVESRWDLVRDKNCNPKLILVFNTDKSVI